MSFATEVSTWCKTTAPDSVKAVTRICVIELGNRAVMRSPVGDASYWQSPPPPGYVGGRFRGNWQYGFNNQASGDLSRIDPSGRDTLHDIQASVIGEFGVHTIVNNLPYAERIENGWSHRQAPQGIVKLIEAEMPEIFRRASA